MAEYTFVEDYHHLSRALCDCLPPHPNTLISIRRFFEEWLVVVSVLLRRPLHQRRGTFPTFQRRTYRHSLELELPTAGTLYHLRNVLTEYLVVNREVLEADEEFRDLYSLRGRAPRLPPQLVNDTPPPASPQQQQQPAPPQPPPSPSPPTSKTVSGSQFPEPCRFHSRCERE
ncbi:hypothetical protein D9613_008854 [Agrocybe pediades]|uniref:Uncharacterized protein n=1 Tax=Agrocybe pediades TaxID=84607 RepID=A0A8H4QSW4_9AGAR|nr:hypothetical protein D9613_008854 [Agrocybe pediades]